MITLDLKGELTAEPRPGQLTNETSRESMRRTLENPKLDPHMRASVEERLAEGLPRSGSWRDADGSMLPYTMLRIDHEGRRFEVSVTGPGKLFDQAVALEPGAQLNLKCELLGQEPHFRLRAIKIVETMTIERVAS